MAKKALRFLLVEDHAGVSGLMVRILRTRWPECTIDATGRRDLAWNHINLEPAYDLIVVDGELEDGHGSDLVQLFSRERGVTRPGGTVHRGAQPRWLGISGDMMSLVKHENAGCHGTLKKPFGVEEFMAAVQRCLYPESFPHVEAHAELERAVAVG